jgi:hypothetical protein|tara:strand:+ start:797 stop:1096 length:300 start_codon:yes stop_codon:yes gene_type:complete
MLVEEIVEGYKQVWGRSKKGVVRRYRCTDGPKSGRVVAKPSTCGTAINQQRSVNLKKTRRSKGASQAIKRRITMKRPTSTRIKNLNKNLRPTRRRKSKR